MNWRDVQNADPSVLAAELKNSFTTRMPEKIETPDEMYAAQRTLSRLASQYSFLTATNVEIKGLKRRMKREKADKEEIDKMMEREELLTAYCEIVKMNYQAISRMISVRQQVYEELKMTGSMT